VQYESWLYPVIRPGAQRDVSAQFEIQFQPRKVFRHSVKSEDNLGIEARQ
jgi:hypothetical protein